jgi:hypothetical protein
MTKSLKLEDIELYKIVLEVADYVDSILVDLPEEERWRLTAKLNSRSVDVTTDVAEAFGSIDPRDKKWLLGMARRDLFGLKNSLKICDSRNYVEIDPEIMATINTAIEETDQTIAQAEKDIPKWFDEMSRPINKDKK